MNTMIINTILAQNSIKLLFRTNLTKETRKKKTKKDDRKRYKFAYERVLIETMIKKHKENETKKMKEVIQKKKTFETKKMISIKKKRIHMKEMTSRKKKREKARIIKKLEKASKLKQAYRRKLFHSLITKQISSISVQTSTILKDSALSVKKIKARSSTSS
jgi:formate dehydrogenase maturation protein FdhE